MTVPAYLVYFGSVDGMVVDGFGMVAPLGAAPSVGGVDGMPGGFTDVSVGLDGVIVELVGSLVAAGAVAEVSADMPVEAPAEPDHQSLLVRALGEAFM